MLKNNFHADGFGDLKRILKSDLTTSKKAIETDKKSIKELVKQYKIKIENLRKSVF